MMLAKLLAIWTGFEFKFWTTAKNRLIKNIWINWHYFLSRIKAKTAHKNLYDIIITVGIYFPSLFVVADSSWSSK